MKHSDSLRKVITTQLPAILMWVVPLSLIIPNCILSFTELNYSLADRIANVLLPLGVYMIVAGAVKRAGWIPVIAFPITFFCAFQIVLLWLYGESIIAIDMFLNVVTTNVHEATELLDSIWVAVVLVCVLYLPPLGTGIWMICKKKETTSTQRARIWKPGLLILFAGICATAYCYAFDASYSLCRKMFPVNVISNVNSATVRTIQTKEYFSTSRNFHFDAQSNRPDSVPEIVVLVIGETSRSGNWAINGYERPTTPRLTARGEEVISFGHTLSESNTTHKSVPLMLSHLNSNHFGDSIYAVKGVITAFREAGFNTAFFSNQSRNGALIDFFGEEANTCKFLTDDGSHKPDMALIDPLNEFIALNDSSQLFVVLHTYGSHFNYREHYTPDKTVFTPDDFSAANPDQREALINAYDNSIVATDAMLDSVMTVLSSAGRPAAMLYLADHGEDIYDDSRHRFLHASPTPTYYQLHVPMLLWMNDIYKQTHPEKYEDAFANRNLKVSSSHSTFHTLLSLAGISTPYFDPSAALTEQAYTEPEQIYLNDYNESVPLLKSGLRQPDFIELANHGLLPTP